jgi:replicative DNA helicase
VQRYSSGDYEINTAETLVEEDIKDAELRLLKVFPGLPIPFPFLQKIHTSFEYGRLHAIISRAGVGKTWFVILCALKALEAGHKVLFASFEMMRQQLMRRINACLSKIDPELLKRGDAPQELVQRYATEARANAVGILSNLTLIGPGLASNPQLLDTLVSMSKPKLIVIDAFYRNLNVPGKERHDKVAYMTSLCKSIALKHNAHVMVTSQFNKSARGKGTSDEFATAFSDAINHESDIITRIIQTKDLKKKNQVEFIVGKTRDGSFIPKAGRHYWDFARMNTSLIGVTDIYDDDDNVTPEWS